MLTKEEIKPFEELLHTLLEHPNIKKKNGKVTLFPERLIVRRHSSILVVCIKQDEKKRNIYIKRPRLKGVNVSQQIKMAERGKREFEMAKMVCEAFKHLPQFGVLRPITYYPEGFAFIAEECQGKPLRSFLPFWYDLWKAKSKMNAAAPYCYLAGQWLRHLHETDSNNHRFPLPIEAISSGIHSRLYKLKSCPFPLSPVLEGRVKEYVGQMQDALKGEELKRSIIHGDFCPANMLVDNGKLSVIDFSTAGEGSIYNDLTHFLLHLRNLIQYHLVSKNHIKKLEHEFLRGYGMVELEKKPFIRLLMVYHTICRLLSITKKTETQGHKIKLHWQWQHYIKSLKEEVKVDHGNNL